jgi:hypothetical protein
MAANTIRRRSFLKSASVSLAGATLAPRWTLSATEKSASPLKEFDYGDVTITSELHERQLRESHAVLMDLSDDSLLKPLRQMAGQPAPGDELGGWYPAKPFIACRASHFITLAAL